MIDKSRRCPDCSSGLITCSRCSGQKTEVCNQCGGTGSLALGRGGFEGCERCGGNGEGTFDKIVPGSGRMACADCGGMGHFACARCGGTGEVAGEPPIHLI